MSSENRFASLVSNTLLFALGTFGSKILVYFLYPLYSNYLDPTAMGTFELIVEICNLITPIMYISMNESMIRFGMDSDVKREDVYTSGIGVTLIGFTIFFLLKPIFAGVISGFESLYFLPPYLNLIYIYVLSSALRALSSNYVRSQGHVKLFAIDGMITILTNIVFNILFIVVLEWGVTGFLLAVILSDLLSAIILTIASKAYSHFKIKGLDLSVTKSMVTYSLPLMPAAVFWWVTNFLNSFIINFHYGADQGTAQVAIFKAANKLPQLLIMISTVFIQAWQLSAFGETDEEEGNAFFSQIFRMYYMLLFLVASGIIIVVKPYISLLNVSYYSAWQFAPFLTLASLFSCLVTFLGTIYNVHKKNAMVTITTAIGAFANVMLSLYLLPRIGLQGAAFATFFSYFLVFTIRAFDTRKYIPIIMRPKRIVASLLLLFIQIFIYLNEFPHNILLQFGVTFCILFVNNAQIFELYDMVRDGVDSFLRSRKRKQTIDDILDERK